MLVKYKIEDILLEVKGKNAMNNKMRYNKSTIRGKISIKKKKTKSNEVIIRLIKTDLNKYPPI